MLSKSHSKAVNDIQAAYSAKAARIRANTGLNERERNRQLARAVLEARDILGQVRADSDGQSGAARAQAYAAAFGIHPTHGAEDRELRAAVARQNPGPVETRQRLEAALSIGDTMEARALAAHAYANKDNQLGGDFYKGVLNLYASHSSDATRQLTALRDADAVTGSGPDTRAARFTDKLSTEITIPDEIAHGSLEGYAAEDVPSEAPPMGMPFSAA